MNTPVTANRKAKLLQKIFVKIHTSENINDEERIITNPGRGLPSDCHQRLLSHYIYFHITQTVACHSGKHFPSSICHNEDGRIQLRKESLLQEVIHSEKLNGAFRRAEAELP